MTQQHITHFYLRIPFHKTSVDEIGTKEIAPSVFSSRRIPPRKIQYEDLNGNWDSIENLDIPEYRSRLDEDFE